MKLLKIELDEHAEVENAPLPQLAPLPQAMQKNIPLSQLLEAQTTVQHAN